MLLINCDINLVPTWSANYFISFNVDTNQTKTFSVIDTKFFVPLVTL